MIKVNIVSGFLGAGKTTLIRKLIAEVYAGERIALIENEFGEIGIDGGFLKDSGIEIKEMNSGCICCSLVGDFSTSLREMAEKYQPERIIIEPTGVGKLSDVIGAIKGVEGVDLELDACITVVDGTKCKMYIKNFGEFYNNQIENANCILMTRMDKISEDKLKESLSLLKELNQKASVITTPLNELTAENILSAIKGAKALAEELLAQHNEHEHDENCGCGCHDRKHHHDEDGCEHHHHDEEEHEHDENCGCGCHDRKHHHDEDGCEHHHHDEEEHHHHGEEHCCDHEHPHHNEDGHGHHHHHGHSADEAFTSWGVETPNTFKKTELEHILAELDGGEYGKILRGKGIVKGEEGWMAFDYVPGEFEIRDSSPDYTGRICVIGAEIDEGKLAELFKL